MAKAPSPFAIGRRWLCTPGEKYGERPRARFWFVIIGPGESYAGVPSITHKLCRIDYHPNDIAAGMRGGEPGRAQNYSHQHLRKFAVLEPLAEDGDG